MASQKRNANRRKFNRQPLDIDDLTSASSFSGIRDVIESHFGKSDTPESEGGAADAGRNVETDPARPQYVWEPKGVPFSVRLGTDVIGRLEKDSLDIFRAITNRGSEVGGILLGRVLPGWPTSIVVEDYEPVACAYTLGPSYVLSEEEQERLEEAIEKRKAGGGLVVVGFFRSNTRPQLVLQEDDLELFDEFFPEDHNIFVLAKPYSRKPCQGAIFVREGGKVRTESSPQEFPLSRVELEKLGALQPGLWVSSQPERVGPASTGDRVAAIPIDSVAAEARRPAPPVAPKPEPPPVPIERPAAPVSAVKAPPEPQVPPRVEPKIELRAEPKVEQRVEPKVEAKVEPRLPWLKPSAPLPGSRPAAPPAGGGTEGTPARPTRPLFRPAPRVGTPVAPPPVEPSAPPAASLPATPPAEGGATSTPASPAQPLFTPAPRVEKGAAPPAEPPLPPSPPKFTTRIQSRIAPSVQPRFMTRIGPRIGAPQPPKVEPKAEPKTEPKVETTVAPTVEPAAPPKPPFRIEPVVVARPPAEPRTEVKVEPKPEPKAEVKLQPRVETAAPRFTKIQPRPQAQPEPAPQPAAPPAPELETVFRRKPESMPAADTAPSFGYKAEDEAASKGWRRWFWPAVIFVVIVVAGVYLFVVRPSGQTVEQTPAAVTEAPPHRQAAALAVRAEGSESGLTIFWDGLSTPISTAPRGLLTIRDGAATKNFDLTSDELKKGTYRYQPRTDDVLIRLELKGLPGNQTAFGGTRILGARRLGKTSGK